MTRMRGLLARHANAASVAAMVVAVGSTVAASGSMIGPTTRTLAYVLVALLVAASIAGHVLRQDPGRSAFGRDRRRGSGPDAR